jgi:cation-transporting ATPase 13A3/4/5
MACCHSLTSYQGQLIGNHLERDMVLQSRWAVGEAGKNMSSIDKRTEAEVKKQFVFDHRRATMSVIVHSVTDAVSSQFVVCKGASESILPLCQLSSEEADEIAAQAQSYAEQGYYVIAFGIRTLTSAQADHLVKANDRDAVEAEASCTFLGFLLFRNELREDSAQTLTDLSSAGVRSMIITGDNAYCGLYIAYQAQLLMASQTVFLGLMHARKVEWHQASWSNSAVTMQAQTQTSEQVFDKFSAASPVALAVSGEVYQHLQASLSAANLARILQHVRVCARAKPEDKSAIVEQLMKRSVVGMVGDGGNDAPALVRAGMVEVTFQLYGYMPVCVCCSHAYLLL